MVSFTSLLIIAKFLAHSCGGSLWPPSCSRSSSSPATAACTASS